MTRAAVALMKCYTRSAVFREKTERQLKAGMELAAETDDAPSTKAAHLADDE